MASDILTLIAAAARQGHDQVSLQAEMAARLEALWAQLPSKPLVSKRLARQLADRQALDAIDGDDAVVAIATAIGADQLALQEELLALTFVVARLGGTTAAFRVGQDLMAALRAIPPR